MEINQTAKEELNGLLSDLHEDWDIEVLQLITLSIEDNYINHMGYKQALKVLKVAYNYGNLSVMRLRLIKDALNLFN